MSKGKGSSNRLNSSDKSVETVNGRRVRGNKAGKGRMRLPFGHPDRCHDGPLYRRNKKQHDEARREWAEADPRRWSQTRIKWYDKTYGGGAWEQLCKSRYDVAKQESQIKRRTNLQIKKIRKERDTKGFTEERKQQLKTEFVDSREQ